MPPAPHQARQEPTFRKTPAFLAEDAPIGWDKTENGLTSSKVRPPPQSSPPTPAGKRAIVRARRQCPAPARARSDGLRPSATGFPVRPCGPVSPGSPRPTGEPARQRLADRRKHRPGARHLARAIQIDPFQTQIGPPDNQCAQHRPFSFPADRQCRSGHVMCRLPDLLRMRVPLPLPARARSASSRRLEPTSRHACQPLRPQGNRIGRALRNMHELRHFAETGPTGIPDGNAAAAPTILALCAPIC